MSSLNKICGGVLIAIALLCAGCGDDAFSQISNIDIPAHDPKTVISAHFVAGDTLLRVALDQSREITDPPSVAQNGYVTAFIDGMPLANWSFRADSSLISGEINLPFALDATPGQRFRLEGQVDGLPLAFAEQIMPSSPAVLGVEYEALGGLNVDGDEVSEVRLTIDPNAEGTDYFGIRIFELNPFGSCREVTQDSIVCVEDTSLSARFLDSPDPLLVEGGDFFFLLERSDIPSADYEILLQFFENTGSAGFELEVLSLTEDGFRFLQSVAAFEDARFDPFSEPVNVHDNITDGFGYFMVSNRRSFRLR